MNTITSIEVRYRNAVRLRNSTINMRMDAADPGTWGLDHPLAYSCPILAESAAESIRWTLGPAYTVTTVERTRK